MRGRWIRRLTGVDRDELVPVFLMGSYGFLAMASYYLVKPVRNAVFVERVGADNLPFVYILTAVFVTAVVLVYSRHVDRVGERGLLLGTFGLLAASLVFFWWLLARDTSVWSSGAFYIWAKLYPLLLVSQFWLVGNLVFTTRQGRRVFGMLGMGLILGGIGGSMLTGASVAVLGTGHLLLLAAAILAPCALICTLLFGRMTAADRGSARLLDEFSGDALRILARSSHLRTIAALLGLTIVVSTLLDWQLNRAVELTIPTEDGMTRFWGYFFMAVNVASVTIQALLTGLVLRRWGVGVAVLVLPAALIAATVGIVAVPALLVVALAKGGSDALRYSLDQSTREVLYLPVPADTKYKVKPLIDLAVYRGGTGVAGLLLVFGVQGLGLGIREVAIFTGVLVLAWVATAVRIRREYVDVLARSIRGRLADVEPAVVTALGRGATRIAALEALARADGAALPSLSEVLLDRDSDPRVRGRVADVLGGVATQESVDALSRAVETGGPDSETELRSLRSLARLCRDAGEELRFDRELFAMVVERQIEAAEACEASAMSLRAAARTPETAAERRSGHPARRIPAGDGLDLLVRALEEERKRRREAMLHAVALLHPSEHTHRGNRAILGTDPGVRSDALEWMEQSVDRELFERMRPVLEEGDRHGPTGDGPSPRLEALLFGLWHDDSPAVASLAVWTADRLSLPSIERRLRIFRDHAPHGAVRNLAHTLLERRTGGGGGAADGQQLDPVERALLLRDAGEVVGTLRPSRLLLLGERARERTFEPGAEVPAGREAEGCAWLVVRGSVELEPGDGERITAGTGRAFGAVRPPDEAPDGAAFVFRARAKEPCRLLELRGADLQEARGRREEPLSPPGRVLPAERGGFLVD